MKRELKVLAALLGGFLFAYLVPFSSPVVREAIMEAFLMLQEYARQHVLLCLIPALFIAGAISVFVSQAGVMKYLGGKANKVVAYGVASVSGAILAVCSCTVLPLFAGIYKRGAGLGPAIAFLYSGPAINILAIILTGRILGVKFGLARAIGAVLFSVFIGLAMQFLFRKEEREKDAAALAMPEPEAGRPLWQTAVFVALMIGILVSANWGKPAGINIRTVSGDAIVATYAGETSEAIRYKATADGEVESIAKAAVTEVTYAPSAYTTIYQNRFYIAGALLAALLIVLGLWFRGPEIKEWGGSTWSFAKLILPYLLGGVLVAGFLLGRPGHTALIPPEWISAAVGGNGWLSNFVASLAGALMYFATLTELPILQGLMGAGMGDGPALALLLAGPALSLPSMLVIRKVLGTNKTIAYVSLVVVAATLTGKLFGAVA
ncbi:MAG: permease [Candidatus Bipolaricaulis sp.]|nr:permease [Candidatus Bipolaricaulis sp.]MDD5645580.1 permease [Candidatus Bipolaricaulis sp.]